MSISPEMQSLKVVVRRRVDITTEYDVAHLCTHLRSLGTTLENFYFSILVVDEVVTFDDFGTIMDICPQATRWTLHGQELGSRLYRMHSSRPNTITDMEFMGHTGYLHDLLCRLPHLLELKATRTGYSSYHMDVFYSTTTTLSLETDTLDDEPPRVWACSRLRTLHMAINNFNADPTVARRTFGYISRVCPRLQYVWICELMLLQSLRVYGMELAPFLNIDGGLCLLTRLKDLRRLRIGTIDVQAPVNSWDIDWLIPLEKKTWWQQKWSKGKRRLWFATSGSQLERDARDVERRVEGIDEHVAAVAGKYGAATSTIKEMVYQLRHCGLLLDVKLMFDELDKAGFQGWPELRRISFCQAFGAGQSVEKEVARLLERR